MYGRKVGNRTLSFGHEGVLYRRSFVMYDKETGSLWVHVTGEAIKGKLKGKRLDFVPSEVVTWKTWKLEHPDSKVLLGRKDHGFMGRFGLTERLAHYGLSVGSGRDVRLYPYDRLQASPVLNTVFGEEPLLVVFDRESLRTKAFLAKARGETLTFEAHPDAAKMKDLETGSTWDRYAGRCLEGKLEDVTLRRLPATPFLAVRWRGFYPNGEVVHEVREAGAPRPAVR